MQNPPLIAAALGQPTEFTPIWCHRQAGRYLPEFLEEKKCAGGFFPLCESNEHASEVTIQPLRRFPLDAAIIFSDILVVIKALGLDVQMVEKKGPVITNPITTPDQMSRLKQKKDIDVTKDLSYVYEAIKATQIKLQQHADQHNTYKRPLLGFAGAPWTIMAYMVEGGGAKSYNHARAWFYKYPEQAHQLLTLITDVTIEYLICQVKAGAQMLEVFDSWAGDLTPDLFDEFALPCLQRIANEVKAATSQSLPMTIFAKGANWALEQLDQTSYDVIAIDWSIQPSVARSLIKNKTIQGNLDVSILYANEETIRKQVRKMIDGFGPSRLIANLGHGMLPDHPIDGLATFIDEVHTYSSLLLKK